MSEHSYIVVQGNPINGFTFTGPFGSSEAAAEYAEEQSSDECWVSSLRTPR